MATAKKAAKKPAAKKTGTVKKTATKVAATKVAAKKPAAKKAAVKKTATKVAATKVAAKKPAAKKTAVKKTATKVVTKVTAKKPAVKKAAPVKKAVAKPAVKKVATKVAAKPAPAKKTAEKVTTAAKPAAAIKKPVATAKPVEISDAKFRNLFDAYAQGKLPFAHGYIVSSFFSPTSAYSIYEIVSYAGVKEIFMTETGLQFVTGGKKLFVLVEPDTYQLKFQEPVSRAEGEKIPKRFNELEIIIAKNQSRVMVAKEPNETYGSFTVLKPTGVNFSIVFYQLPEVYDSLASFFVESLNRQRKIPEGDAKKAAQQIVDTIKKSMSFEGEYQ